MYGTIDDLKLTLYANNTTLSKNSEFLIQFYWLQKRFESHLLSDITKIMNKLDPKDFGDVGKDMKWILLRLQNKTVKEMKKEQVYEDPARKLFD